MKTLVWLESRNAREATNADVATILGDEVQFVRRRPIQIFGAWTDHLVWTDVTGRFEIVFARTRNVSAPFSNFRFSGAFGTRDAAVAAIAAWLALIDPAEAERRMEELRTSSDSYVEYETRQGGESIRISLGITQFESTWRAGVDVENIGGGQ